MGTLKDQSYQLRIAALYRFVSAARTSFVSISYQLHTGAFQHQCGRIFLILPNLYEILYGY